QSPARCTTDDFPAADPSTDRAGSDRLRVRLPARQTPRPRQEQQERTPHLRSLHKKSRRPSSLCNLCVLCVSVVDEFQAKTHHRDTENTEVAQKNQYVATFCAKPVAGNKYSRSAFVSSGTWFSLKFSAVHRGFNFKLNHS